jgi:hypothetical protein
MVRPPIMQLRAAVQARFWPGAVAGVTCRNKPVNIATVRESRAGFAINVSKIESG